jgi:hypothetical protein
LNFIRSIIKICRIFTVLFAMNNPSGHNQQGKSSGYAASGTPRNLPNANLVLILGILSILFCWWHLLSVTGLILGCFALVFANRETRLYYVDPGSYTAASLNNVKAGRTCALIGITISVIIFAFVILMILGILTSLPFWGMIH